MAEARIAFTRQSVEVGKPQQVANVKLEPVSQLADGCYCGNVPVSGGFHRLHGRRGGGDPLLDAKFARIFAPRIGKIFIAQQELDCCFSTRARVCAEPNHIPLRQRPEPAPAPAEGSAGQLFHPIDGRMRRGKTFGQSDDERRVGHSKECPAAKSSSLSDLA